MITAFLSAVMLFGSVLGTHVPYPVEDDKVVDAILTITSTVTGSDILLYEPTRGIDGRRIVYVGVGLDDECTFGSYWTREYREWSPLILECD